ncbi:hypothetical protein A5649_02660 [Mycolicibacter heraklionensis]|uniref:HTH cro/C1-type domain-containing protein n=1 Tax=Mycolicibacter heraklionensis TaxID=512402 RepID=A0AA91IXS4_9MYCO|nr:helix-turn-helix transcriptional regulator [Mycolicibacter heraklionensis]OBK85265.1 hypothetical protein A5649_02660 [Mycolicibacter heraklionensis]
MDDFDAWPAELAVRLGEAIRAARTARGMSAVKLAEATSRFGAGVHRVAIPRIEAGKQMASVAELISLGLALDSDWLGWLIRATNELPIPVRRDDDFAYYRKLLIDVDGELETLRHNLHQAEQAPLHFQMSDQLREKIAADTVRYRATIAGLEQRRTMILDLLGESGD